MEEKMTKYTPNKAPGVEGALKEGVANTTVRTEKYLPIRILEGVRAQVEDR